jgi:hypothetical protein
MGGKQLKGQEVLIREQLARMHQHILQPMGATRVADTIAHAVEYYSIAREECEEWLAVSVIVR